MNKVFEAIAITAEMYNQTLSDARIRMMMVDLSDYSDDEVLAALAQCRKTCKFFPTIADIIQAIPSGHLSGDEAWALCPKTEDESCVWTEEMAEAFGAALPLLDRDHVAARKSFLAAYDRLVKNSMQKKRPVKWLPSLGHNKNGHAAAILDAVKAGRLPVHQAIAALPEHESEVLKLTEGAKMLGAGNG